MTVVLLGARKQFVGDANDTKPDDLVASDAGSTYSELGTGREWVWTSTMWLEVSTAVADQLAASNGSASLAAQYAILHELRALRLGAIATELIANIDGINSL